MLSTASALPIVIPVDGQPVEQGHVYVAVPDHHLLLLDNTVRLGDGPRENMARPAIDPLFRSAALSYGPRAVGVVLSGMLNDGASGLAAIKACGGTAIVQHPLDAASDQMPLAALEVVDVDEVSPADHLAQVILDVIGRDACSSLNCPDSLALEVEIAAGARLGSKTLREFADASPLTCPDCHGVLSEVRGQRPLRYRCQIGHAQTADVLDACTGEIDDALRVALRIMEERVTLVTRMAQDARESGRSAVAELYEMRAAEFDRYAQVLRDAALKTLRSNAQGYSVGR
jgi:two-component system chemotaxis response regulator CheB